METTVQGDKALPPAFSDRVCERCALRFVCSQVYQYQGCTPELFDTQALFGNGVVEVVGSCGVVFHSPHVQ